MRSAPYVPIRYVAHPEGKLDIEDAMLQRILVNLPVAGRALGNPAINCCVGDPSVALTSSRDDLDTQVRE